MRQRIHRQVDVHLDTLEPRRAGPRIERVFSRRGVVGAKVIEMVLFTSAINHQLRIGGTGLWHEEKLWRYTGSTGKMKVRLSFDGCPIIDSP